MMLYFEIEIYFTSNYYLPDNFEEVGISFFDQVTEDIVVDWEWTLVANDWECVLNFFFSLLSKSCFTLSWELELVI